MSTNLEGRAWVHVRADALRRNYRRIVDAVGPGTKILPMVKADAYGLGVRGVVSCLEPLSPWGFGVATVREGVELREAGVERPVVVCSPTPFGQIDEAVRADLQLSVSSLEALRAVDRAAASCARKAAVHMDVDTGMGRSGFDWRLADEWLPAVTAEWEHVRWVGCYTHLHSADENDHSVVEQWDRLSRVLAGARVIPDGLMVHVLNSAGVFRMSSKAEALVRPGIFLYGGLIGPGQPTPDAVASVHARVVHVRDARPGTSVGYGATYTASGPERWATLSIGYGDGFPRALGNRGHAIIEGARVPIIGRISMDVTVVDISDVPPVAEGAVATLVGSQGSETISLDEVARQAGTISYEILTGLTPRLPRIWSDGDLHSISSDSHDKEKRSS